MYGDKKWITTLHYAFQDDDYLVRNGILFFSLSRGYMYAIAVLFFFFVNFASYSSLFAMELNLLWQRDYLGQTHSLMSNKYV